VRFGRRFERSLLIAANTSKRLRKEAQQHSRIQSRLRICPPPPPRLPPNSRIGTRLLPPQLCQRCFLSLSIRRCSTASSSHRNQSNAGRCFINTPIVNCYHLIKSHFPRAFHDSADQEERLLRRSVIKTAALVPRLVCPLPVPSASSFSSLLISLFFSLLPLPPPFSLFLYQFRTMIMKSLTSTSIDPLNGNVYPNCEKLRDHA